MFIGRGGWQLAWVVVFYYWPAMEMGGCLQVKVVGNGRRLVVDISTMGFFHP